MNLSKHRDQIQYDKHNYEAGYLLIINREHWCQNRFQVIKQVSIEGIYRNWYDVMMLMKALPIVQIELERRGLELKAAFNQANRYQRHSNTA